MFEAVRPFVASGLQVKFVTEPWEADGARLLRRQVFCAEQGIFRTDDRDAMDDRAITIVALSSLGIVDDDVIGTVRINRAEPGIWWGSRLAVAREYRRLGAVGVALIRMAVGAAHARGCQQFLAHVQSQNTLLFQRHHWHVRHALMLHGKPHHLMEADLAFYPPCAASRHGLMAMTQEAA